MSAFKEGDVVRISTNRASRWMFNGENGKVLTVFLNTIEVEMEVPGRRPEKVFFETDELVLWNGLEEVLRMVP